MDGDWLALAFIIVAVYVGYLVYELNDTDDDEPPSWMRGGV